MKDVHTHSGNHLREFYYWASLRNPSGRGHLAHNNKLAGFTMQAVYTSTCEKMYTGNGSKQYSGLCLLWKMSLQASCQGLLSHEKGLLVGPPNHAPPMSRRWSAWERLHLGWVRESAVHSHGVLAHLKEICIPFRGALMQCHQASPSTPVHPIRLRSSPGSHYVSRARTGTREVTALSEGQRASGCPGGGTGACRSRWIRSSSKLARQRHKREATCTSTAIERGPRLLHPALCKPRKQPRRSSYTAGCGRSASPGHGQGRAGAEPGRAEGGPAPRAWRPLAAAAAPRTRSCGRAPAGPMAPARRARPLPGSDGRVREGGERRELYI